MWVAGGIVKEHCCGKTRMWEMELHSDLKTLWSLMLSVVVTLEQSLKKDCQHACLFTITFLPSFTEITDFLISSGRNPSGRILSFQNKLFASKLTFILLTSGHFYSAQIKISKEGTHTVHIISLRRGTGSTLGHGLLQNVWNLHEI